MSGSVDNPGNVTVGLDEKISERVFGRTKDQIVPRYSKYIDMAWIVVDEMREQGWRFSLSSDEHADECVFWRAHDVMEWVGGDSVPEIICRAALAALDAAALQEGE